MSGKRIPASTGTWQDTRAQAPGSASSRESRPRPVTREVTREIDVSGTSLPQEGQPCLLIIASYSPYADALWELLRVGERQVEMAADGLQGLRLADLIRPDILLCDLELRGIPSAYAIARTLRSDPGFQHVHLVGLTGHELGASEEYAIRAGFDEIVQKSGDIAPIEEVIRRRHRQLAGA
jgi:CheY-like chemotaxis protein